MIGTSSGLVKQNKLTNDRTFYLKTNSGLPDNNIESIAVDSLGNVWLGTFTGFSLNLMVRIGLNMI